MKEGHGAQPRPDRRRDREIEIGVERVEFACGGETVDRGCDGTDCRQRIPQDDPCPDNQDDALEDIRPDNRVHSANQRVDQNDDCHDDDACTYIEAGNEGYDDRGCGHD